MGIIAFDNTGYTDYYRGTADRSTQGHALTYVGFPNGGSASVFKMEGYSEVNPQYRVRYWGSGWEKRGYIVDPTQVDPSNASYVEMLAYATYSDKQGATNDAFGKFITAANGVNADITYDLGNIDTKENFKGMIEEYMQMQHDMGDLQGYMSYRQLYDYMDASQDDLDSASGF